MNKKGFTLIELLVVIAIVILLAGIVMVAVQVTRAKGRDGRRSQDLIQFRDALEIYASDHNGEYPPLPDENIYFTSKGVNTTPTCPAQGSDWTQNQTGNLAADNYGNDFLSRMSSYIPTLPKDPTNDETHCYVYAASPQLDVATAYGVNETGQNADNRIGIVAGDVTHLDQTGAPNIPFILGVTSYGGGSQVVATVNTKYIVFQQQAIVVVTQGVVSIRRSPSGSSTFGAPSVIHPGDVHDPLTLPFTLIGNVSTATGNIQIFTIPNGDRVEVTAL